MGLANELFSSKIAGTDMKHAVLKLMNQIKTDQVIPEMIKMCNISSILDNNLLCFRGLSFV